MDRREFIAALVTIPVAGRLTPTVVCSKSFDVSHLRNSRWDVLARAVQMAEVEYRNLTGSGLNAGLVCRDVRAGLLGLSGQSSVPHALAAIGNSATRGGMSSFVVEIHHGGRLKMKLSPRSVDYHRIA